MKRVIWIALGAFVLGIMLAGYVFVIMPEKKAEAKSILAKPSESPGTSLFADTPQFRPDLDFVSISEKIGPTVVRIDAERVEQNMAGSDSFDDFWDRFFGNPQQRPRGGTPQETPVMVQGTGFFISADGYLLTNNHIVEKAKKVTVFTVSGEEFEAKVVGTDPATDVALIKVETKDAPFAELGDSSAMKVGEWVLAIGNPLGMEHTVTVGIISAKGRNLPGLGDANDYQDFIQTDAAINRGNSGGPLVNLKGQVIGINSNILTPSGGNIGIGFAIPSEMAKKVVIQLKEKGRVVRGRLGVSITRAIDQDMQKALNLKDRKGALINAVEPGTPADKAGLKRYDVIVAINGQPIASSNDLRLKIADMAPGTPVQITYVRDGKEATVKATVIELANEEAPKTATEKPERNIGLTVEPLTPASARRYGLRTESGLLILEVVPGSAADRRGLQRGDVIVEANRQKMETMDQWKAVLKPLKAGDALLLAIRREDDAGQANEFLLTLRLSE